MTEQLTDQQLDLDAIQTLANAATPGPWGAYQYGGDSLIEIAADLEETGCGYSARRTIARLDEEPLDNDPSHREWTAEEDWAQVQADAAYIAAMSPDVAAALVAEVRRLRAELAAARVTALTEGAAAIDHLRATMLAPPVADLYATGLSRAAGELRRLAAALAEETHVVADDSDDPEHIDDCPGCETGTRPCGHDDYHDPHEWADRPGIWCPGISYADDQPAARSAAV